MKIIKLDIDENSILAGIDAVALVEQPAIEEDFLYFSKQEFAILATSAVGYLIHTHVILENLATTKCQQQMKRNVFES